MPLMIFKNTGWKDVTKYFCTPATLLIVGFFPINSTVQIIHIFFFDLLIFKVTVLANFTQNKNVFFWLGS